MVDALHEQLRRSRELGFLGPGPIEDHVRHARAFLDPLDASVPADGLVLDLGSGGGVPGLVLAVERPRIRLVLLDGMQKRAAFLEQAVVALGLRERALVRSGRAEELARAEEHRGAYDAVVARSFGPPAVAAECARGFLREGGTLLVSEPPEGTDERWPADPLLELGLRPVRRWRGTAAVQELRALGAPPDDVPRRVGVPAKRPRF